jgi:3-oxoadipate CoA-transferase beta subunit
MDLEVGARQVFIITEHNTKNGEAKIVHACSYPLTAVACVSRISTDQAIIDVTPDSLVVREWDGLTVESLGSAGFFHQPPVRLGHGRHRHGSQTRATRALQHRHGTGTRDPQDIDAAGSGA